MCKDELRNDQAIDNNGAGKREGAAAVESLIEQFVFALAVYIAIGIVVGLVFLAFFISRLDEAASGASLFFRPMIFLGCVAIWPFVVARILSRGKINEQEE